MTREPLRTDLAELPIWSAIENSRLLRRLDSPRRGRLFIPTMSHFYRCPPVAHAAPMTIGAIQPRPCAATIADKNDFPDNAHRLV